MRATSPRQAALLLGTCGVLAAGACSDDRCDTLRSAAYQTLEEISGRRIQTLDDALLRQGRVLSQAEADQLSRSGHLLGLVSLDRPVKHPDRHVEMPAEWLPPVSDSHPWASPLTPADDAFFSWFEERIIEARLFDPDDPNHRSWAGAYLDKGRSANPSFHSWTYASSTECTK